MMNSFESLEREIKNELLALNSDEQRELENSGMFRKSGVVTKYSERRESLEARRINIINSYKSELDASDNNINQLNNKIAKLANNWRPSVKAENTAIVLAMS